MKSRDILLIFMLLGMTACSENSGETVDTTVTPLQCDVFFNVKTPTGMRMANEVVQTESSYFRGLQRILVMPFETEGDVTATDQPMLSPASGSDTNDRVSDTYLYYMTRCLLLRGVNHVLAYGQAAKATGKTSDAENGVLETNLIERMMPSDMTFSLKSIRNTTEAHDDAKALADYLTAIAKTEGWSDTSDSQMKALYLDFIHADTGSSGLMAGSAANVKAYANALKTQLETIRDASGTTDAVKTLCESIITKIGTSPIESNNYPGSLGLPDGAAVLRWMYDEESGAYQFKVRTETTTLDNINGINRYTYPAELWYYVNSPILTSAEDVEKSKYETAPSWEYLLQNNYQAGNAVTSATKSVAVEDPLQYGVARLQMTLITNTGTLKDAKDHSVTVYAASNIPLTGVIIGGQHTVGFDFQPVQQENSDLDARFIYDPVVGTSSTMNTLVLQSYDNEKVPVILELRNETGSQFTGIDGIVYPGCKFYLIAQLDPADKGEGAYAGRVFTQDYTTSVTMKVVSLAQAYSCMPDLLEPRLEIGVEIQTDWIQSTTTTVRLD